MFIKTTLNHVEIIIFDLTKVNMHCDIYFILVFKLLFYQYAILMHATSCKLHDLLGTC